MKNLIWNKQHTGFAIAAIALAAAGGVWFIMISEPSLPGLNCIDELRAKSAKNPVLTLLKAPMDSVALEDERAYRKMTKDSTRTSDYTYGRLLICTVDSLDGFLTYYTRDRRPTDGLAWGSVIFFRYRIRQGVLSLMPGSTSIAIAGTKSNPIPPWEVFDKYAMAHLRQMGILNEHCETVDSVITFGDVNGNPASRTFHAR